MVAYYIYFIIFIQQLHLSNLSASIYYLFIQEADCRTVDAFDKELLQLRRCDRRKMKMNGQHSHRGRQRTRQSLREASIQSSSSISLDRDKNICSNGDQKGRAASTCSLRHLSENLPVCSPKKQVFSTPVQPHLPSFREKLLHYIWIHCQTKCFVLHMLSHCFICFSVHYYLFAVGFMTCMRFLVHLICILVWFSICICKVLYIKLFIERSRNLSGCTDMAC